MYEGQYDREVTSSLIFSDCFCDITPYDAGEQRCCPLHFYGPAVRNYWLLHYVISGKGVFEKNGRRIDIKEKQCFIIKPYETAYYQADEKEPWHYVWMGFKTTLTLPERFTEHSVIFGSVVTGVFEKLLSVCRERISEPDMIVASLIGSCLPLSVEPSLRMSRKAGNSMRRLPKAI